jgi:hypothetical protein
MFSQEEGIPSRTQVIRNTTEDLGLSEQTLKQTRMEKEYEDALEFTLDGKKGETLAENNLGQEERLEGHNASKDSPNNARVSPNWNELMEEKIAEPINQELSQEKGAVENLDEGEEKLEKTEAHKKYDQMVRQSERIKEQGLGGIKIVDKASMVARKKNLEGNNLNLKNSFAVLDSLTLVNKFSKMGGNSDNINLEHFDLLKDLELARNDLKEKVESLNRGKEEVDKENLPLEELKIH